MARPKKVTEVSGAVSATQNHVEVALAYAKNKKLKDEVINPPKLRNYGAKDYSGMDMADMYPSKEIKHGDFSGCNLDHADFRGFNLQGCIFKSASLNGTLFQNADLRWANFQDCDTSKVILFDIDENGLPIDMAETHEVDGMTR